MIAHDEYIAWMGSFGKYVNQIFSNEEFKDVILEETIKKYDPSTNKKKKTEDPKVPPTLPTETPQHFRFHTYLNSLAHHFPTHFPDISHICDPKKFKPTPTPSNIDLAKKISSTLLSNVGYASRFQEYILAPSEKSGIELDKLDATKIGAKLENMPGFPQAYAQAMDLQSQMVKSKNFDFKDDPEIIILGTGSMMPGTYRNVSAINVRFGLAGFNMIMDCGEGTFSQ